MRAQLLFAGILLAQLPAFSVHAQTALLTPQSAFAGATHGDGTLKMFFGKPRPYHVRSLGKAQADGYFSLDQTVAFDGEEIQTRRWLIREVSPLHYTGTLSDAAGTVHGLTSGPILWLKYRVKGPFTMHQTLKLMSDGETIDNVGEITLLGIPVGSLHEIIRRDD